MSKRHFIALAAALKAIKPPAAGDSMAQWIRDTSTVADACMAENPRFDRARFLAACGW